MDNFEKAAYHLLEDEMTPQKAVSLTQIGTEIEEDHELYDIIEYEVQQYLEDTEDELKGFSSTGEKIEISEVRNILQERREKFKSAIETAYGNLDESDREMIDNVQQSYLNTISQDITRNGEPVKILEE
ncbi:hypothetical protein [Candidatus Nanohalovita haloferacivicina]|uniref:hypothetical protein n=1 Tax=Candidatus Nanohalovita haloferacivicina TaxID=2978046 RepID=UPI00325FB15C|nr:hypothetical protein HBNXNv_0303 [Candidatus Nanohalobia archaeon BNXNv]